jgi:hypothetical protein
VPPGSVGHNQLQPGLLYVVQQEMAARCLMLLGTRGNVGRGCETEQVGSLFGSMESATMVMLQVLPLSIGAAQRTTMPRIPGKRIGQGRLQEA